MLAAIPIAWKIGAASLLVVLLAGCYAAWTYHQRAIGAERVIAADQKAIADQAKIDARLNEKIAVQLQARVTSLESIADAAGRKISAAPVVPGSQAEIDAAAAVRCLLDASLCAR